MASCPHGERILKSGVSAKNGKPWSGLMCPAPKGEGQCEPLWQKDTQVATQTPPASQNAATSLLEAIDAKLAVVVELLRDLSTRDIKF